MTLATSHVSAERPKASRRRSSSSSSSAMTLERKGWMARLGATAFTRTPAPAASSAAQRVRAMTPALAAALGRLRQAPLVVVGDHHGRALLGATPGGGEADSGARRRGDDDHLARQQTASFGVLGRAGHVASQGFAALTIHMAKNCDPPP